jgi:hypothetical protein
LVATNTYVSTGAAVNRVKGVYLSAPRPAKEDGAKSASFASDEKKKLPSVRRFCQSPHLRLLDAGFLPGFSSRGAHRDSSGQKMFEKFLKKSGQGYSVSAKRRVALH